jgi:type 1 glutamine amidotransferase
VASENEYKTESTLPRYFVEHLGKKYRAVYVFADPSDEHRLAGLEQLSQADMLLLSMRRRTLPEAQLKAIREFVASGRPIVAIRTSSHAFVLRDGTVPDGRAAWPEFDRDVLGGNYTGHHANSAADAPRTIVERAAIGAAAVPKERQADFAILQGVSEEPFPVRSWLYKTRPLSSSAVPLLWGRVGDSEREPVAWTNLRGQQRVFYTSLGHPDDFQQQDFQVLLRNGIDWAAAGLPSVKR